MQTSADPQSTGVEVSPWRTRTRPAVLLTTTNGEKKSEPFHECLLVSTCFTNPSQRSIKYTEVIQTFIDDIQKREKKKTSFAQRAMEEACRISEDQDPIKRSQHGLEELRTIVSQLDDTHKKTDTTRRASQFLRPFFESMTRYTEVIETLVSSNPTIAALVWGGVKCVLQVRHADQLLKSGLDTNVSIIQIAGQYVQHYDNLTNLLQKLEPYLCNIGRLSEIFDWSESLCNVVTKSYQDIFNLLIAVAESYEQSGGCHIE